MSKTDPTAKKQVQALSPGEIDRAEVIRNTWRINVKEGVAPDQLLETAYWAHVASRLTISDRIEAVTEDMAWVCDYIVVDKGDNWARVIMITKPVALQNEAQTDELPPGYEVTWKGPLLRWVVTRKNDQKRIAEKISDKATANLWVRNHVSSAKVA